MKKEYTLLWVMTVMILVTANLGSAAASDLEGESRSYKISRDADLTSYDESFEGSASSESDFELEFADTSDSGEIQVLRTSSSDGGETWIYVGGLFSITEIGTEFSTTTISSVIITESTIGAIMNQGILFVLFDPETYLEDMESGLSGDEYSSVELTSNSLSYVQETDETSSSYLPADMADDEVTITNEVSIEYSDNGLLDSYTETMVVQFGDVVLIDSELKIRSGLLRAVTAPFPSVVFYIASISVVSIIARKARSE